MNKWYYSVVVLFTLTGCVPLPHFISLSPYVMGKVTQSGKPVANANVFVNLGNTQCKFSPKSITTKTDTQGNFEITEQSAFQLFYAPMVAPLRVNDWELCIEQEHKTSIGITDINFQADETKIRALCDLAKPHDVKSAWTSKTVQVVCEITKSSKE